MRRPWFALLSLALLCQAALLSAAEPLPYRWVRLNFDNFDAAAVEQARRVIEVAAAHGLNGIALSGAIERLDLDSPYAFKAVKEIVRLCQEHNLAVAPFIMNVGYNAFMLQHDKNLAEGLPVRNALFIADATAARHVPDPAVGLANSGFEEFRAGMPVGFTLPYPEREIAFQDRQVFHAGGSSIRFEKFGQHDDEARVSQELTVRPGRLYKVSFWVRTEGLDPSSPFGSGLFRVEVLGGGERRRLAFFDPQVPGTSNGWRKVEAGFNSKTFDQVELTVGVYEGQTGRFWLDDLQVEEIGLVNLLRRPGAPLTVRDEADGVVYEEGRDFARVEDPHLNFLFDHAGPALELLPGGRIKEGTRLRVDYHHGVAIYQGQTPICMSEPSAYAIWRKQMKLYQELFQTDLYILNADEIRVAASCEGCKSRGLSAPQILADCLNKQLEIVREVNPRATIFTWSDMFDPHHNANQREYYYLVDEDWYGSWELIPKDLVMLCWHGGRRDQSLAHFSGQGFRTMGAAYYDADDLKDVEGWLESLNRTAGAVGIMYTTWLDKYDLLDEFGDLVSGKAKK